MKILTAIVALIAGGCWHGTDRPQQHFATYETMYTADEGVNSAFISDGGYDTLVVSLGDSVNILHFKAKKYAFTVRVSGSTFAFRYPVYDQIVQMPTYRLPATELVVTGYLKHDAIHFERRYLVKRTVNGKTGSNWIIFHHHGLNYECL